MSIKNKPGFELPPPAPVTARGFGDCRWRGEVIARLVERNNLQFGAELGLWEGRTMDFLLTQCPHLNMIGVDLWEEQPGNSGPEDYVGWDHGQHEQRARNRLAAHGNRATIIKGYTVAAAEEVSDGVLDFVFFDADHSEYGLRADYMAWKSKLRRSGFFIFHDINWPSVRGVVEDLFGDNYAVAPDNVAFVRAGY